MHDHVRTMEAAPLDGLQPCLICCLGLHGSSMSWGRMLDRTGIVWVLCHVPPCCPCHCHQEVLFIWQSDIHMKARTQDFPEENYIVSGWSVLFTSPGMLRQEWKYSPLDEEAWTRPSALLARPRPLHPFHPLRSSPPQSLAPCSRRVTSSRHLFQSTCLPSCPRLGFYSLMANWAVFLQYFSAPSAQRWLSDRLVSQTGRCHQESPVTEWTQCVKMHVRKDRTPPAKMGWSSWMAPCASGGACSGICPVTTGRRVEKADGEEPRKQTHNPNRTPVTNRSLHILCPFGIFFLSL